MIIEHWIGADLVTIDTEDAWRETFAAWDGLVPTDTAAEIATAVVRVLEARYSNPIAELAQAIADAPKVAEMPYTLTPPRATEAPADTLDLFTEAKS